MELVFFQNIINSFEENEGITGRKNYLDLEVREVYMEAVTSGEGPDVLIFDNSFFGNYTISGIISRFT